MSGLAPLLSYFGRPFVGKVNCLPSKERIPHAVQMTRHKAGDPVRFNRSEAETKIPEPIIVPTIRATPLRSPTCSTRIKFIWSSVSSRVRPKR